MVQLSVYPHPPTRSSCLGTSGETSSYLCAQWPCGISAPPHQEKELLRSLRPRWYKGRAYVPLAVGPVPYGVDVVHSTRFFFIQIGISLLEL